MAELLLIVSLAGRRVAIASSAVEAVVELEGITPVPGAAPHIAGLSALRSRVLTVVCSRVSLGMTPDADCVGTEAIVIPSGGHTYALMVDMVEDVVEASGDARPLRAPPGPGWERVAKDTIEAAGDLLLLVDPHALIAGPAMLAAA